MLDLEYIEIDGLFYPNIETGMEEIEQIRYSAVAVSARV